MNQQNLGSKRSASVGAGKVAAKSQEAAEQLKDAAVEQVNQVRERAYSARSQASGRIHGVAAHLRELSDTLREDDTLLSDVTERASRGIESVADYVGGATPQSLVRDTERLARRQPALFYGGAFMLGLALGRFMKGASDVKWEARDDDDSSDFAPDGAAGDPGARRYTPSGERQQRTSGFYPSGSEQQTRSSSTSSPSPRFQEKYEATVGRGVPRPDRSTNVTTGAGTTTGTGASAPAPDGGTQPRGASGEKGTPA